MKSKPELCEYGCGNPSKFLFDKDSRSIKWCCSDMVQKCPTIRKKLSDKNKGKIISKCSRDKISKALTGKKWSSSSEIIEIERKRKISEKMKNYGGYRKGSGRGKKGTYKGFWCDSSYELAYVVYCLDHGVKIKRNNKKFPYFFNNKKFNYIPDFIIEGYEYTYVEIKGYMDKKNEAKINQFPHKLKVFIDEEMNKFLDYVINKYGKDFIKMYEIK